MLTSISKRNPLVKNRVLERAFAKIKCKMLLEANSRVLSVLVKIVSFVKIAFHTRKLC